MSVKEIKLYSDASTLDINTLKANSCVFKELIEYNTVATVTGSGLLDGQQLQGGIILGNGNSGLYVSSIDSAANIQNVLKLKNGQCVQVMLINKGSFAWDLTITDTANMTFNQSVVLTKSVPVGTQKILYVCYTGDDITASFELFI